MNIVIVVCVECNLMVKNEIVQKGFVCLLLVGFFVYLISQVVDIIVFKVELVLVGDDQLLMIEQINEIVYKMNSFIGELVLCYCKVLFSEVSCLLGVDGNVKMLKLLGNMLMLLVIEEEIYYVVSVMYIDLMYLRVSDLGYVEGNVVFIYFDVFYSDKVWVVEMKVYYQCGGLGDCQCKNELEICLQMLLVLICECRVIFIQDKGMLLELLCQGSECVYYFIQQMLYEVKCGLGLFVLF